MSAKKGPVEKAKKESVKSLAMPKLPRVEKGTLMSGMKELDAMERCRAVLAVWTERRKAAEVCRELSVPPPVFGKWQERALEGMLQALEPRVNLEKGAALSSRLQRFLEKRTPLLLKNKALEDRLSKRLLSMKTESPTDGPLPQRSE